MVPVQIEVHRGIARVSLDGMNEGRTPLPSSTSLNALPEAVKDEFRETRAEGAGDVNIQVDLLSPFVDSNRLVLDTPDKSSFLLSSLSTPGVFPVHKSIPQESASPSRLAKVHWRVNVAYPLSGSLCRELK